MTKQQSSMVSSASLSNTSPPKSFTSGDANEEMALNGNEDRKKSNTYNTNVPMKETENQPPKPPNCMEKVTIAMKQTTKPSIVDTDLNSGNKDGNEKINRPSKRKNVDKEQGACELVGRPSSKKKSKTEYSSAASSFSFKTPRLEIEQDDNQYLSSRASASASSSPRQQTIPKISNNGQSLSHQSFIDELPGRRIVKFIKPIDTALLGLGWRIERMNKRKHYFVPGDDRSRSRLHSYKTVYKFLKSDSNWKNHEVVMRVLQNFEAACCADTRLNGTALESKNTSRDGGVAVADKKFGKKNALLVDQRPKMGLGRRKEHFDYATGEEGVGGEGSNSTMYENSMSGRRLEMPDQQHDALYLHRGGTAVLSTPSSENKFNNLQSREAQLTSKMQALYYRQPPVSPELRAHLWPLFQVYAMSTCATPQEMYW